MTDNSCIEQEALVEYLYGEADDQTRQRIETHARGCAQCADEIGELREVRGTLETWSPPPAALGFRVVAATDEDEADLGTSLAAVSRWGRLRRMPAWGLAAAAVLVLATAAVIARPEVQIGQGGMVVRIGWIDAMTSPAQTVADAPSGQELAASGTATDDDPRRDPQPVRGTPVGTGGGSPGRQPRLDDSTSGPTPGSINDAWVQGVRQMILESERRQDRALVIEMEQFEQQLSNRRRADLAEMERMFAELGDGDSDLVRRRMLDYMRRLSSR
ncbi:MAG TPA: zf-HC2 domain-containing protein [Acidobacteria bacterium]|nr:zf-HC2 domain-containing protein [Acidobacteriota bacterium]